MAAGAFGGSGNTLHTHVYPQPRQSEREIGQAAADWQTARLRGL
jgi:hypothetical protein